MPDLIEVTGTVKGPLFSQRIDETTKRVIVEEVLDNIDERVTRIPRSPNLGRKNNTIESRRQDREPEVALGITSTLNWPRTRGTAWLRYNVGAIKKLAPNVIRKAGKRLAEELGGQ